MDGHRPRGTLAPEEVRGIFVSAGALLDGHFLLTSGRHSAQYIEKFRIYEHPRLTERLCGAIVERLDQPVDVVVGPTMGGLFLAYEVARQLDVRALYAERREDGPGRTFRRGQVLGRGERVLVVDDIVSTGGSVRETIDLVLEHGARVVAAAVLMDRGGDSDLGVPVIALWRTTVPSYEPAQCPLCARGSPAVKPGTSRAAPRRTT